VTVTGELVVVRHADGSLQLEEGCVPPPFAAFTEELVDELRHDKCTPWCTIDGDTITMRLCPVALYYRLTGEVDVTGALVAQRMDHEGRVWT
jgi:hypothetical protein